MPKGKAINKLFPFCRYIGSLLENNVPKIVSIIYNIPLSPQVVSY